MDLGGRSHISHYFVFLSVMEVYEWFTNACENSFDSGE